MEWKTLTKYSTARVKLARMDRETVLRGTVGRCSGEKVLAGEQIVFRGKGVRGTDGIQGKRC